MANDTRSIQGTVTTATEDGKHQVTMSLMKLIAHTDAEKEKKKDKDYWLNLYAECWHVVSYGSRKK